MKDGAPLRSLTGAKRQEAETESVRQEGMHTQEDFVEMTRAINYFPRQLEATP